MAVTWLKRAERTPASNEAPARDVAAAHVEEPRD